MNADPTFRPLILTIVALLGAGTAYADTVTVPGDFATLQAAIDGANSGDVIELAAGSYAGTFVIDGGNANKSLTIRAAAGAAVTLTGSNAVPVLRYIKGGVNDASVVFRDLTIANGRSTTNGVGGGVTVTRGNATFIDCVFEDNTAAAATTGGGALFLFDQSVVHVYGSRFENNTALTAGGGVRVGDGTVAVIHDSELIANSTSVAGHIGGAAGGAVHMTNAELRISNSRFEDNRAGCGGGAVYALGSPWVDPVGIPRGTAWIVNSTFVDNATVPFGGQPCDATPVGGAVHSENQIEIFVINNRFEGNFATTGGAITQYRSKMTVDRSVFRGNFATGASNAQGFGGAIMSNSNDVVDATTAPGGTTDRPSSTVTIRDSLFQGRFGAATTTAVNGGCLWSEGDVNRTYGRSGVPIQGSAATNRAAVTIERTIFADCDVAENDPANAAGKGGAITAGHTALTLDDVLIFDSDAPNGGGGLWTLLDTDAQISGTTFAYCTSEFGGAINASGSVLDVVDSQFFGNQADIQGAAIWTGEADDALTGVPDMDARGTVQSSTFSDNGDGANRTDIYDRDKNGSGQPINRMRYVDNDFYDAGNGLVYDNSLTAQQTPAGINSLTVAHPQVPATIDKGSGNVALGAQPSLGEILAKPGAILPTTAAGDPTATAPSYLGYAWSGGSATLDGGGLGGDTGGVQSAGAGVHTLSVDGNDHIATIANGPAPAATFSANPPSIGIGQSADLTWSTTAGTFVDVAIDRGVTVPSQASGTVDVSPLTTTEYQLYVLTEEGGTRETETLLVGESLESIFSDGFESGDLSAWAASVGGP